MKEVAEKLYQTIEEDTAQEVPVQEQYIKKIVHIQLNKFKKIQFILLLIQLLTVLIFGLMLIKEKLYVHDLIEELTKFQNLLRNF